MASGRRWRLGAALAVALLVTGACTSSTRGSGSVASARGTSPSSSVDFPSTTPSSPSSVAVSTGQPSSPPSAAPSSASAPPECSRESDCKLVKSWNVGGGYVVAAFGAPKAAGGVGSSVLLLARQETPVYWHVFDSETPSELLCKVAGLVRNCVLVDLVGAHGASAYPLLVADDTIKIGTPIGTDTPGLHVADLNGDLLVDAYGLQNDYKPDYASGHVQWQTWQRGTTALTLVSTGCGPLGATAPADPARLLTGRCAGG